MEIRKATPIDRKELQSLWDDQYEFHFQLDPGYYTFTRKTKTAWSSYLKKSLTDSRTVLLIAFLDGRMCGFLRAALIETLEYNNEPITYAEIEDIYVIPQKRGEGIGIQLLQTAEKMLQEKGAKYVRVQCHNENIGANEFYGKLGYSKRQVLHFKPLVELHH